MKKAIVFSLITFLTLACEKSPYSYEDFEGDWKLEDVLEEGEEDDPFIEWFSPRVGLSFTNNQVEHFNGYFDAVEKDSFKYIGNFSKFSLKENKILFERGFFKKEPMEWEILNVSKDTIYLKDDDGKFYLKRINFSPSEKEEFDQIIYSTSGCYGTCPIMDISLDLDGNLLFFGEGYVHPAGIFKGSVKNDQTDFVFQKFRNANPMNLENAYTASITDLVETTISFIKNGKIIKTIVEYGYEEAPDELIWAYVPISNLPQQLNLEPIREQSPPIPDLEYYVFIENDSTLILEKSEGFYLWTELASKGKLSTIKFKPKYNIRFFENFTYWGPRPPGSIKSKVKSVTSDGQYFKFEFQDSSTKTFDLGYDFIRRNFNQSDFKEADSTELNKFFKTTAPSS